MNNVIEYFPARLYRIFLLTNIKVNDLQAAINQANFIEITSKYPDPRYKKIMTVREMIEEIKKEICPFYI